MSLPTAAIALHEAHLEEARVMASSSDPGMAAAGRASRDISLALIRWHEGEKAAGTDPAVLGVALNTVLGHALAGFVAEHGAGAPVDRLAWHIKEIVRVASSALGVSSDGTEEA